MKARIGWMVLAGLVVLPVVGWPFLTGQLARHLEQRLRRETGRDWRIAGLGLAMGPSLDLQGVTTGDAETSLSFARVRVSAPVALLMGGTGMVRLRTEDVRLRLPLAGGTVPVASPDPKSLPADMRAVTGDVRGVVLDMPEGGRHLDASVKSADFSLDLGPAPGGTALSLTVDGAGHEARLSATVRGSPGLVRIEALGGTLDSSAISGNAQVTLSDKAALTADLRLDDLTLRGEGTARTGVLAPGPSVPIPTAFLPDPRWLALCDADLRFTLGRLAVGPARLDELTGTLTLRAGALDVSATAARAYDGEIKVRYGLTKAGTSGRHRLVVVLNRAQLRPLLSDFVDVRGLDARTTARIDIQATGLRTDDLPRTATGFADIVLSDGRLDGITLLGGGSGLGAGSDLGAGSEGPFTRFHTLGGSFSIAEGRAVTSDLHLRSPLIESTGTGSLDLVARTLDLRFQPSVTSQRERRSGTNPFTVPVRVSGPWHDPAVAADMSGLLQNPGGAVEALQDLGTGLFGSQDKDGGKGGDLGLGGFLDAILPKAERDAPASRRR